MRKKKRYLVWQQTCVRTLNLYILKMHTFLGYIIPLLLHSAKQNEHIISTLLLEGFFFPGLNIFVEETSFLDIKSNALGDHLRFFCMCFCPVHTFTERDFCVQT